MIGLNCSVLVPYRPDAGWRDAAWERIETRWQRLGAEVIVESPGPGAHPGEFNHPLAINRAAERATRDVLMVADADCGWTLGLPERLVDVVRGGAPWALALDYAQLTKQQTRRLHQLNREPTMADLKGAAWVGRAVSWAGLICITADAFREVGGYDERYEWWGADDMAFGLTADTLLGKHARVPGAVIHYWHPAPLEHNYGHERHQDQYALGERYKAAAGDVDAMRCVRFNLDA